METQRYFPTKPVSNQKFGTAIGGVLSALGGGMLVLGNRPVLGLGLLGLGVLCVAIAVLWSDGFGTLKRVWLGLGAILSRVVSPVVLTLIFYGVVCPIAVLAQAFGYDPLTLRRPSARGSFWIPRKTVSHEDRHMRRPF